MNVSDAVAARFSVRAFKPDPVPEAVVRDLLARASRAPSGGNTQPWTVQAIAGERLAELKRLAAAQPEFEEPEFNIYPQPLWEPLRTRRYECGEDLYRSIGVPREDKAGRLRQRARNLEMFGAPVGLFFFVDRRCDRPQWADLGMFMQTFMLLAVERGLGTCAQEYWAHYHSLIRRALNHPSELMLYSGMALGYVDEAAPINQWRTKRDPVDVWARLDGF